MTKRKAKAKRKTARKRTTAKPRARAAERAPSPKPKVQDVPLPYEVHLADGSVVATFKDPINAQWWCNIKIRASLGPRVVSRTVADAEQPRSAAGGV